MAFVPGYQHDVFVSYANTDDVPIDGTVGWVSRFVRNLQNLLAQRLGRADAYSIWMDRRLLGNEPFPSALIENIRQSATLLIIQSPGYLQSEWCKQERNWFLEALRQSRSSDHRVFVIEIDRTDKTHWPNELAGLRGWRFWHEDEMGIAKALGWPVPDPRADQQYYQAVDDVARSLIHSLKNLRDTTPDLVPAPPNGTPEAVDDGIGSPSVPSPVASEMEIRRENGDYDVFLCHNSEDKPSVRLIGELLLEQRILLWLDDWDLRPGLPWQEALESQIEQIKSAAVFVGGSGFSPWQNLELAALLREFASRRCPVIPVILEACANVPQLPPFLRGLQWVDFRRPNSEPLARLVWGITGKRPKLKNM